MTNDTFAPLRALRWPRAGRRSAPRRGRAWEPAARMGPPEAAGRWSLVSDAVATSIALPVAAPPTDTERRHALAHAAARSPRRGDARRGRGRGHCPAASARSTRSCARWRSAAASGAATSSRVSAARSSRSPARSTGCAPSVPTPRATAADPARALLLAAADPANPYGATHRRGRARSTTIAGPGPRGRRLRRARRRRTGRSTWSAAASRSQTLPAFAASHAAADASLRALLRPGARRPLPDPPDRARRRRRGRGVGAPRPPHLGRLPAGLSRDDGAPVGNLNCEAWSITPRPGVPKSA